MNTMLILSLISACGLIFFFLLYHHNPTSLFNGFVFDCELGFILLTLIYALLLSKLNLLGQILLFGALAIAALILLGGIWIFIGFLLVNAIQVFKRERHTLQNMLSMLVGLGLVIQIVLLFVARSWLENPIFLLTVGFLFIIEGWIALTSICFVTISWLCRADRPRLGCDYVIVLGAGLLRGDEVSPLLAGRIDCGIKFYQKAVGKNKKMKLIFSGGQGPDEKVPEARAMRDYAIAHGVPAQDILTEERSRNTQENFRYSKALMEEDAAGRKYKSAYVTSDYHVLRGRMIARKEGLPKTKGLGSRTAAYYVTNAMIREYVAVMLSNKKSNLTLLGILAICYAFSVWMVTVLR